MKKVFILFGCLLLSFFVQAQEFVWSGKARSARSAVLENTFTSYSLYDMNSMDLFDHLLITADQNPKVTFRFNGKTWKLNLWATYLHDENASIRIQTENGSTEKPLASDLLTFHGRVGNDPQSLVALTVSPTTIYGFIEQDGATIYFEPLNNISARCCGST